MVSWGRAFGTALDIVLMSIVWYIIGIVIIALGGVGVFLTALSSPYFLINPLAYLPNLAVPLIALIIGGAMIYLGQMATLLKYSAELVADEVRFKQDPIVAAAKSLGISTAGKTRVEVADEIQALTIRAKVCPKCGVRSANAALYCDNCGERL
jgi:hypothetical protein